MRHFVTHMPKHGPVKLAQLLLSFAQGRIARFGNVDGDEPVGMAHDHVGFPLCRIFRQQLEHRARAFVRRCEPAPTRKVGQHPAFRRFCFQPEPQVFRMVGVRHGFRHRAGPAIAVALGNPVARDLVAICTGLTIGQHDLPVRIEEHLLATGALGVSEIKVLSASRTGKDLHVMSPVPVWPAIVNHSPGFRFLPVAFF